MKAKFTTYLELDIKGTPTPELVRLIKTLQNELSGRKQKENPVFFDLEVDTRMMTAVDLLIEDLYISGKNLLTRQTCKLSHISGQRLKCGRQTLKYINYLLEQYGFDPATN